MINPLTLGVKMRIISPLSGPMVQPGSARQIVDLKIASSNLVGPVKYKLNPRSYSAGIFFFDKSFLT